MSEHLEKAKGALNAAREVDEKLRDTGDATEAHKELSRQRAHLLDVAHVQATVALAEAAGRIADVLVYRAQRDDARLMQPTTVA